MKSKKEMAGKQGSYEEEKERKGSKEKENTKEKEQTKDKEQTKRRVESEEKELSKEKEQTKDKEQTKEMEQTKEKGNSKEKENTKVKEKDMDDKYSNVLLGKTLQRKEVLDKLSRMEPKHEVFLPTDPNAKLHSNIVTQWHGDEYGIVIQYPTEICVIGPDFCEINSVKFFFNDYVEDGIPSPTLHVTKDLVGVELKRSYYDTSVYVFNRATLEKVYSRPLFKGHMSVGIMNGNKELFLKYNHKINKKFTSSVCHIDANGTTFDAWTRYTCCKDKSCKNVVDVYFFDEIKVFYCCLLYTSPSPRDLSTSRMPSSA